MKLKSWNPEKMVHAVTLITLGIMVVWGLVSVFWEVRPFWVDEWRIIYNLKFKTVDELWGPLAYMQQFPRAYISLLKVWTEGQGYSYFSLRLPSLLVAFAAMVAVYSLARRIWPTGNYRRYLLVLMLVSCGTFTEYFVQIKQYTMDLFLAVLALWQLVWILDIGEKGLRSILSYLLLCAGMLLSPFFSYTYPIVIAPVFVVVFVQDVALWRQKSGAETVRRFVLQWLPLFLCTFSITLFYIADVAQLSADAHMREYWRGLVNEGGFSVVTFVEHIFHMLAQPGSGLLFWWLFGLLCTVALGYGGNMSWRNLRAGRRGISAMMLLYAVVLILAMMLLNVAGRLPLGEPRLNSFAVPAIAILLINLLDAVARWPRMQKAGEVVSYILIAGLAGNVVSTVIASFTDGKYERRMATYRATEAAIKQARAQHLPVLVTPEVAWPYDKTRNLPDTVNNVPGDWVLMTWPAFDAGDAVQVYNIMDTGNMDQYIDQLPGNITEVMVGDGLHYRKVAVERRVTVSNFSDTTSIK
ncbi:MAG: hypothetical protein KF744_05770 [Taibaiella sp.]|nr:hypothetical protein [Taibaiella sp.]